MYYLYFFLYQSEEYIRTYICASADADPSIQASPAPITQLDKPLTPIIFPLFYE